MQETIPLHLLATSLGCDIEVLVQEVRETYDRAASPETPVSMDVADELRKKFASPPKPKASQSNISNQTSESVRAPDSAVFSQPDLGEVLKTKGPNVLGQEEIDALLKNSGETEPPRPQEPKSSPPPQPPPAPDSTPTHTDNPSQIDLLGRKALAKALAARLRRVKEDTGESFLANIHGPWGAGKSTLLGFLRRELHPGKKGLDEWVVVDFNAWQHRGETPPWWALMNAVFRQAVSQTSGPRSVGIWIREQWWRFRQGHAHRVFGVALLIWAFVLWIYSTPVLPDSGSLEANLKLIGAALALVATLWAGLLAVTNTLLPGTSGRADAFYKASSNPVNQLAAHLKDLARWIRSPVVVLMDDLDRCDGPYVVSLLESVQTLFRDAGVVFVVAADRRWLSQSFEDKYKSHAVVISEPGRPLGYLFLEKVFQVSIAVPHVAESAQKEYWRKLLRLSRQDEAKALAMELRAELELSGLNSEAEVHERLKSEVDKEYRQALRHAAIVRLATPEVEAKTSHALEAFSHLLEANPRSMKRLVNAYGMQRAIALLNDIGIETGVLALWTILSVRWPVLAEYLGKKPEMIQYLAAPEATPNALKAVPESLRELFESREVRRVAGGEGVEWQLDRDSLSRCLNLSSPYVAQPEGQARSART